MCLLRRKFISIRSRPFSPRDPIRLPRYNVSGHFPQSALYICRAEITSSASQLEAHFQVVPRPCSDDFRPNWRSSRLDADVRGLYVPRLSAECYVNRSRLQCLRVLVIRKILYEEADHLEADLRSPVIWRCSRNYWSTMSFSRMRCEGIVSLFSTTVLNGSPAAVPRRKSLRYLLDKRLGGPQNQFKRCTAVNQIPTL
jgi:hypothetical protein